MDKINIIQFAPYFPPHKGGMETHIQEFSTWWVKSGYGDIINITVSVGQEHKGLFYEENGYKVYIIPSFDIVYGYAFPKFWTKQYWQVFKEIKQFKADLVITRTRFFLNTFMGGVYAKIRKLKRVHFEHGSDYADLPSKFKQIVAIIYDSFIGKWVFKKADKLIGVSNASKNFIINKFVKRDDIQVVQRGIDFKTYDKISSDIIRISFVGRLVKLKGVDFLLQSFENLIKKGYKNIFLNIVGDGDELKNLTKFVEEKKLTKYVKFWGFQTRENIAKNILNQTDIVVNPSFQEGLPTSVLEGLISKCVVIASDVGGTAEISDQKDLILIKPGNVLDLEYNLEYAIKDYQKFAGKSYEFVLKKFSWEESVKKDYLIFEKLLNEK